MDNKFSFKNFKLLPKKQQRAVYTIVFSLLGFALVVILSCVFIFAKGKAPSSSSESESSSQSSSQSDSTAIDDPITDDKYGDTILKKQDNKDADYLTETLFVGDSNTERLMEYGHISIDNFVGKTGLSIKGASGEACVYFKNDDKAYTIPKAIAKMKPRRVVVTLGTNDAGDVIKSADFVKDYQIFLKAVTDSYPHAKIIINSILPVTKNSTYQSISMNKINEFNEALADMAHKNGYSFLNSSEALRDTNGYGKVSYFTKEDGVHLVDGGARVLMDFVRTHPETGKDNRPDTKNIPARRAAPSAASSSSSSKEEVEDKTITYSVQMDGKTAMGSLKNDSFDKKTSYTHTFKDEDKKFGITAVAADGYTFSKWSDGVKEATRSDAVPKDSAKITAQFTKLEPISVAVDQTKITVNSGVAFTINATVKGAGADVTKVIWKVDGTHVSTGAKFSGKYDVTADKDYKIEASYPEVTTVATTVVTVKALVVEKPTTISINGEKKGTVGKTMGFSAVIQNAKGETTWDVNGTVQAAKGINFDYTPNAATNGGTISISATNNGVKATINITVEEKPVDPAPTKTATIEGPATGAVGIEYTFKATVKIGSTVDATETSKAIWSVTGGGTSTGEYFKYTFAAVGTYVITASPDGGGTSGTMTITIS